MQPALKSYDIGVIIGRFQVHELHGAQRDLIDHVLGKHEKVVVLLGVSPLPVSTSNPLDFESRKQMILAYAPDVTVLYVKDMPSDDIWSRKVDEMIDDIASAGQTAVLYGSRDSFIQHYTGKLPTQELMAEKVLSGTLVRKQIAKSSTRATPDFRAGVIWASQARFPTVFTTVDVAILDHNQKRLLLARKAHDKLYCFVGGFADPTSTSFEADAIREVREETTLEIGDLRYLGSHQINDWRYRSEPDGIRTLFYAAAYVFGRPEPQDDIEELRWFDLEEDLSSKIVPYHRPLYTMLKEEL